MRDKYQQELFERYSVQMGCGDFEEGEPDDDGRTHYRNANTQGRWNFWVASRDALAAVPQAPSCGSSMDDNAACGSRNAESEKQAPSGQQAEPTSQWEDPRVQTVYSILCSEEAPPPDQHWEGWTARRIVDALAGQQSERPAPAKSKCALCGDTARIPPTCDACHDSMGTRPAPAGQAVGLTTAQIDKIWHGMGSFTSNDHRIFARAIEQAHGIHTAKQEGS